MVTKINYRNLLTLGNSKQIVMFFKQLTKQQIAKQAKLEYKG